MGWSLETVVNSTRPTAAAIGVGLVPSTCEPPPGGSSLIPLPALACVATRAPSCGAKVRPRRSLGRAMVWQRLGDGATRTALGLGEDATRTLCGRTWGEVPGAKVEGARGEGGRRCGQGGQGRRCGEAEVPMQVGNLRGLRLCFGRGIMCPCRRGKPRRRTGGNPHALSQCDLPGLCGIVPHRA